MHKQGGPQSGGVQSRPFQDSQGQFNKQLGRPINGPPVSQVGMRMSPYTRGCGKWTPISLLGQVSFGTNAMGERNP